MGTCLGRGGRVRPPAREAPGEKGGEEGPAPPARHPPPAPARPRLVGGGPVCGRPRRPRPLRRGGRGRVSRCHVAARFIFLRILRGGGRVGELHGEGRQGFCAAPLRSPSAEVPHGILGRAGAQAPKSVRSVWLSVVTLAHAGRGGREGRTRPPRGRAAGAGAHPDRGRAPPPGAPPAARGERSRREGGPGRAAPL
jgi:hypothetical protein